MLYQIKADIAVSCVNSPLNLNRNNLPAYGYCWATKSLLLITPKNPTNLRMMNNFRVKDETKMSQYIVNVT